MLFRVGFAHEVRLDTGTFGPLVVGAAFGGWLVWYDRPYLRGTAPTEW